jgi:hypothetical protein
VSRVIYGVVFSGVLARATEKSAADCCWSLKVFRKLQTLFFFTLFGLLTDDTYALKRGVIMFIPDRIALVHCCSSCHHYCSCRHRTLVVYPPGTVDTLFVVVAWLSSFVETTAAVALVVAQ